VAALLGALGNLQPTIIGLNCSTGPQEMREHIARLRESWDGAISMLPNAGMPVNVDDKAVYTMEPEPFAQALLGCVQELGVGVVGGCCGTSPDHIAALARALKGVKVSTVSRRSSCYLATGIGGVDLEQLQRPVIIGERLNAQGSRKTKELILQNNLDELANLAHEQVAQKSSVLDLCVAINERDDEPQTMLTLARYLSERLSVPFCIDSTDVHVFEQVLPELPAAALINSINLEHGAERARTILSLARRFGCPVVALTIDDSGMAQTLERKLELAKKLYELAVKEFGLPAHWLYIDPLVFTLATGAREGADAASISIEALRAIKKHCPGVRTVMGVSNVSFGLAPPARRVLNNLMLHHAVAAGLDGAIYNPAHLDKVEEYAPALRELGEDVLFNRREDALERFVALFEQPQEQLKAKKGGSARGGAPAPAVSPEEALQQKILLRQRSGLEELLATLLTTHSATAILNELLLPAMATVGEKMARGEMILPFVLQAAEIMQQAVTILQPHLAAGAGSAKGTIVMATVYGDVHDIGKNLVGSIVRNQGYTVIDLGKQVAVETIVEAVRHHQPAAVGLSALLVTTSKQMQLCVQRFHELGIAVPVIIGGAAVNQAFAERVGQIDKDTRYAGGVYYARDAFDALKVLEGRAEQPLRVEATVGDESAEAAPIEHGGRIEPPFYGTGEVLSWQGAALVESLDKERLFKGYWRGGALSPQDYERERLEQFEPIFERIVGELVLGDCIQPRALYAFFPAIVADTELILLEPGDFCTELVSFECPRIARKGNRSIADYVSPEGDVVAIQMVTLGDGLGSYLAQLARENRQSDAFFAHGLASMVTEALAEKVTREIRRSLYLSDQMGRRYSFGYPGMPSVDHQWRLFELLSIEERLGVELSEGFQMQPEFSTMGIYIHHPDAQYM
jgi:5-methyltetrahydrofolate--homocysteine methyltransferase